MDETKYFIDKETDDFYLNAPRELKGLDIPFPTKEIVPEACITNDLHVSQSEFSRCALCSLYLIEEEIKAHVLCDPTLLDVCPKCQIKSKRMGHIHKPVELPDDLSFLLREI